MMCPTDTDCGSQARGELNVTEARQHGSPLARENWIDRAVNIDSEEAKVSDEP